MAARGHRYPTRKVLAPRPTRRARPRADLSPRKLCWPPGTTCETRRQRWSGLSEPWGRRASQPGKGPSGLGVRTWTPFQGNTNIPA